jgi:TolB protein
MPQISSDKKWIVFEGANNQILLYNISKDTIIDINPGLEGSQSPGWLSAEKVVFVAGRFPDITLYQMDLAGKNIEPIIKTPGMRYGCKTSPDGKRIAYRLSQKITDGTLKKGLAIYDMTGRTEKYITSIGEYPSWSPDGKQLAFHWKGDKNFAVFTVNADGSELKKIAEDKEGDCELPVWSADGRQLFFQTNRRHGNWEIWVMNVDGTEQKPYIWN